MVLFVYVGFCVEVGSVRLVVVMYVVRKWVFRLGLKFVGR